MIKVGNAYFHKEKKIRQNALFEATLETTKRQIEKCGLYRQLCKQKNFDPKRDLKSYTDLKNIPYLSTAGKAVAQLSCYVFQKVKSGSGERPVEPAGIHRV